MKQELTYKIEVFEGPLDLLLALISKNKIDIADIPISDILKQYLEYLDLMKHMDMEIAGEFIIMASELMLIKSKMLLPKPLPEGEEDPRQALAMALLEYKHIKDAAVDLDDRQKIYSGRFTKDTDEIPPDDTYVRPYASTVLRTAMLRVLMQLADSKEKKPDNIRPIIKRKIVPVSAKIVFIMKYLIKNGKTHLDTLFLTATSRSEVVALFMATLELIKADRLRITDIDEDDVSNCIIEINKEKRTAVADEIAVPVGTND